MTKGEKHEFVKELTEKFKKNPNFFVIDIGGFSVERTNDFRRSFFKESLEVKSVKNTLIKKSLEAVNPNLYAELFPTLKESSTIIFIQENPNGPAKLVKEFKEKYEKPVLKAACYDGTIFIGENSLDQLISLKSKTELIGEIVGLLQSPAKNVISALKSNAGDKIGGLIKALEERNP